MRCNIVVLQVPFVPEIIFKSLSNSKSMFISFLNFLNSIFFNHFSLVYPDYALHKFCGMAFPNPTIGICKLSEKIMTSEPTLFD